MKPGENIPLSIYDTFTFYKQSRLTVSLFTSLKNCSFHSEHLIINQNDYLILVEPCIAGQYLDPTTGCQNCPADHWSAADNKLAECTACPSGKGVDSGSGTSESACTWSKLF